MIRAAAVVGMLVLGTAASPPPQPSPARGEGAVFPSPLAGGSTAKLSDGAHAQLGRERGPSHSVTFTITGDAIETPLGAHPGDPARGAAVVRNRETANCLICHSIPDTTERFMGEIGPPLAGVGARLTPGQIRLRVVDPTLLNPRAAMPAYHRTEGLTNVDPRYAGRPVLDAGEIEDVVAYLTTLKE